MPLTQEGAKILADMKKSYGDKQGEKIFYATINAGKKGSEKWHEKTKNKKRKGLADI